MPKIRIPARASKFGKVEPQPRANFKAKDSPDIVEHELHEEEPHLSMTSSPQSNDEEIRGLELKLDEESIDARDPSYWSERGNSDSGPSYHCDSVEHHPRVAALKRKLRKKQKKINDLKDELLRLKRGLYSEQEEHRSTRKALFDESAELRAANVLLGQPDSFSCADVVNMTADLNFDIEQIAARIALSCGDFESLSLKQAAARTRDQQTHQAEQEISAFLGADFIEALHSPAIKNDQGIRNAWIQFTLQAYIVSFLHRESSKNFSNNTDLEAALTHVYTRLIHPDSAFRPLAGRWRTLTHAVCREPTFVQQLAEQVLRQSRQIIVAFGGIDTIPIEEFLAEFRHDMESIFENLSKLNVAIKEKIPSLRVFSWISEACSRFDPEEMIDVDTPDSPQGGGSGGRIFFSVSLGLGKRSNTEDRAEILLKPKVVLQSLLHSMGHVEVVEDIEEF